MKRSIRVLVGAAPLLFSALAWTDIAGAVDKPHLNAYAVAKAAPSVQAPKGAPAAFVASIDAQRGVPSFLWAARGASSSAPIGAAASLDPEGAARAHLARHAARYGLSQAALGTAVVQHIHDVGRGGIIVTLRQRPLGIELFHNDVKVLLDRQFELVAIGGSLHAAAVAKPKAPPFTISDRDAVAAAFRDLYGVSITSLDLVDLKQTKADYRYYDLTVTPAVKAKKLRFTTPARVKKVFFPMPDRLVPGYFLEIVAGDPGKTSSDAYGYVIAADDGRVLYRQNLTLSDAFTYQVWADPSGDRRPTDGPLNDFNPHPTGIPDGTYPPFSLPQLITIDGFNKNGDPWLPAGGTQTQGNNVDAYTDDGAPDGYSLGDIRGITNGGNQFQHVYDPSLGPQATPNQRMAAVTQIFYTTNWLHDWWYDSGFDEAAGNAQKDNYGRGGIAGDALHAEAQDSAPQQRNNANMSAMADGASPKMQMYVWDGVETRVLGVQPINVSLQTGTASFGPQQFNVTDDIALAADAIAPTSDGCTAIGAGVSGKIALIDRGNCTYKQKAVNAQAAGAVGVLLVDNVAGSTPPQMPNGNPNGPVTIPMLSVTTADGALIKAALQSGPVTATMAVSSVDRDGTIDNSVVAHEWGHYLHQRLVACGSNVCEGQSEGWADFNALMMAVRAGDQLDGTWAVAQYATAASGDAGYFGIRRYPYTIDMNRNGLTFRHIQAFEPLPQNMPSAQTGGDNAESHNTGEVWATMLFEGLVAILQQSELPSPPYDFATARRRMSDYVVAGMKLAPPDPTFTEQRDGVLAAAAAADANDFVLLAKAFAKRGAGTCAVSPPRYADDNTPVVEAFAVKSNFSVVSVTLDDAVKSCDDDGYLDLTETGNVTVTVMNTGTSALSATKVTVSTSLAQVSFPSGPSASFGPIAPYATSKVTIPISLLGGAKKQHLPLDVVVEDPDACVAKTTISESPWVSVDEQTAVSNVDDVEPVATAWTISGADGDVVWTRDEPTPGDHAWHGDDYAAPSDTALVSPPLSVSASQGFKLTFSHRYQFEASEGVFWDGGVVEVSTDGGNKWTDASKLASPSYGGVIGDPQNQASNVLKGRLGYVDTNISWPSRDTEVLDFGDQLAGKTVLVRFRLGTDDAAGAYGWEVDDLDFEGIDNKPFAALVGDASKCDQAPIADAGPDQSTLGGKLVMLDGSKSSDPDGDKLTFSWKQLSGPAVVLNDTSGSNPSFVAPSVVLVAPVVIELAVNDGQLTATDTVKIVVGPSGSSSSSSSAGASGGQFQIVDHGGCGCRTAGEESPIGGAAGLAGIAGLAGLALKRRRRR